MSIVLHAIALMLWLGVVFFASGLGLAAEAGDRKSSVALIVVVFSLFAAAFALQVIA